MSGEKRASGGWGRRPQTPIRLSEPSGDFPNHQNGVWGLRPQPPEAD
jgi:hypothetical protein